MSNNIGELFKVLGKNETFANYVKEIENGKSTNEIIDFAVNDNDLMEQLMTLVSDVAIIKSKMEVIIGQKKRSFEKKNDNANTNAKPENNAPAESKSTDKFSNFSHKPFNLNNVVWLDENTYLERIDMRLRLVTTEFEMYY